jgi:hypothetical protein
MTINITSKPLSLTDRQLRYLQNAARAVPVRQRDAFLQSVAKHLASEPSDLAVMACVNAMLDRTSHHFLNDSLSKFGDYKNEKKT